MSDERRYQEDEIREIFEEAARARDSSRRALGSGDGLSLTELEEIGLEVGLSPERIQEAARAVELRRGQTPRGRHLGMPISVGRTVELTRAPTDQEWELLVAELRDTFGASGRLTSHGSLRQWSNGNLFATVEPTESGHRLRLGSRKGNAIALSNMGMFGLGLAAVLLVVLGLSGQLAEEGIFAPLLFAVMGGAALTRSALMLPGWAEERERQMEYIAGRAQALLGSGPG